MTSSTELQITAGSPEDDRAPSRRGRLRFLLPVLAIALLAAGCSSGPGSQAELEQILTDGGTFTESEAMCIAEGVFDEYGENDDALSAISSAPNFEFLDTEDGVPGFSEFFDETVGRCAAVGPTTG